MDVQSPSGGSSSTSASSSSSSNFPAVTRATSSDSTASETLPANLSERVRKGSVGDRYDPELATALQEGLNKSTDPVRIAIIGKRGVGKSTWVNSVRELKPTEEGAAKVSADEVVDGMRLYPYYDHGLVLHDIPGAEGSEVEENMGEDYIKKFELHTADACVLMYTAVLDHKLLECAKVLDEKNVPVFLVRNKVGTDCRNQCEDGKAKSLHAAFHQIRDQAYKQLHKDECHKQFACSERLFLVESKYKDAVEVEPPQEDPQKEFHRLKDALHKNIRDEAKRKQVEAAFTGDAKVIAATRAAVCRGQRLLLTVMAAVAAAVPLPGVSSVAVISVAHLAGTHFLKTFRLTQELSGLPELNALSKEVLARVGLMSVPALSTGVAVDCLAVFPGVGLLANGVVGSTLAASMMFPFFDSIIVKLEQVAVEVYLMNMKREFDPDRLHELVRKIFNEAPEGRAADAPQVTSPDGTGSGAVCTGSLGGCCLPPGAEMVSQ